MQNLQEMYITYIATVQHFFTTLTRLCWFYHIISIIVRAIPKVVAESLDIGIIYHPCKYHGDTSIIQKVMRYLLPRTQGP